METKKSENVMNDMFISAAKAYSLNIKSELSASDICDVAERIYPKGDIPSQVKLCSSLLAHGWCSKIRCTNSIQTRVFFPATSSEERLQSENISIDEAVDLVEQALLRLKNPGKNANGGNIQLGGIYWRLAKVLDQFVNRNIVEQEGESHALFIRKTHGILIRY